VVDAQKVLKGYERDDPSPPDFRGRKYSGDNVLLNRSGRNAHHVRGFANVDCKLSGLRAHARNIAHWMKEGP
jgi:hypothetical protein